MSEQTKTKPPVKRWQKAPDKQLERSDQSWKARVSRMKTVGPINKSYGHPLDKKKESK